MKSEISIIACATFLGFISGSLCAAETYWQVTASALSLRATPSQSARVIASLPQGAIVRNPVATGRAVYIDGIQGEWLKVTLKVSNFDAAVGYLFSGHLRDISRAVSTVQCHSARLASDPSGPHVSCGQRDYPSSAGIVAIFFQTECGKTRWRLLSGTADVYAGQVHNSIALGYWSELYLDSRQSVLQILDSGIAVSCQ